MSFITTKLLTYVSGALGAVALAAGSYGALQTSRLHEAQGTVTALQASLGRADAAFSTVVTVANERAQALTARDGIITAQSGSIDALKASSDASRTTYLAGISKADQGARGNEARAAEIIRLPAPAADRRCEAAATLIREELKNVR